MAATNAPSAAEYIVHHLSHLNTSGAAQKNIIDFSIVNLDTVFYSVLTAAIGPRCPCSIRCAASIPWS